MSTADKNTTNFVHYKHNAITEAGVSASMAEKYDSRIHKAYDLGEPVWMIADELRLRCLAPKKQKTPKELAISFTRLK